jgi:hypothetical protein
MPLGKLASSGLGRLGSLAEIGGGQAGGGPPPVTWSDILLEDGTGLLLAENGDALELESGS